MTSKGKRLTYLTIALGVLVLLVAGYAFRDKAVEQWFLWKLNSEDEGDKKRAIEKLAEMGSVLALPVILRIVQRTNSDDSFTMVFPPESYVDSGRAFVIKAENLSLVPAGLAKPIKIAMPNEFRLDVDGRAAPMWLVPVDSAFLLDALWKLTSVAGKRSEPYLVTALDDSGWYVPYLSALLLRRMGPNARHCLSSLCYCLSSCC